MKANGGRFAGIRFVGAQTSNGVAFFVRFCTILYESQLLTCVANGAIVFEAIQLRWPRAGGARVDACQCGAAAARRWRHLATRPVELLKTKIKSILRKKF